LEWKNLAVKKWEKKSAKNGGELMRTIYVLSDGTKSKTRPEIFSQRNEWISEAKGIVANLKHTKKLKGNDLLEVWLNDPAVKRYRELLSLIWNFRSEKYIVEEITCCDHDKCEVTEDFYRVTVHTKSGDWDNTGVLCAKHASDYAKMWTSEGYSTATIKPV
jgi:hypothetical protein